MADCTLGAGLNDSGGTGIKRHHPTVILHHHREPAIGFIARHRAEALDNFELQHKVHILNKLAHLNQVKQQGRGNIVGQVADKAHWSAVMKLGKVGFQGIATKNTKVRIGGKFLG